MKSRILTALLFISALGGSAFANETVRSAQEVLQKEGYYFGPIDGTKGEETTQAIKRYQIRNGVPVSGDLDNQTVSSLNSASVKPASPSEELPAGGPPLEADQNFLKTAATEEPAPDIVLAPQAPVGPSPSTAEIGVESTPTVNSGNIISTPKGAGTRSSTTTVSRPLQGKKVSSSAGVDPAIRDAQANLKRRGFYRGSVDGIYGPATRAALLAFQRDANLHQTGVLDEPTMATLGLVAGSGPVLQGAPVIQGGGYYYPAAYPYYPYPRVSVGFGFGGGRYYYGGNRYYGNRSYGVYRGGGGRRVIVR